MRCILSRVAAVLLLLASCCPKVLTARLPAAEQRVRKTTLEDEASIMAPSSSYHIIHECINTTSADGTLYIKSEGTAETCGLFLFSDADTVIEIQLEYVNVPCHTGGLIALVDGWEMDGQLWPSPADHERPAAERVLEFCGTTPPAGRFRSAQNAALLQYRLPTAGSALSIRVRHVPNPTPCNQLMDGTTEVFTLRNFGQRRNCTLLSMNPVEVQVLPFHVGAPSAGLSRQTRAAQPSGKWTACGRGFCLQCADRGWPDFVELGETSGLDTELSTTVSSRLCGLSSAPGPAQRTCNMFVTRLVSSGLFDNVVRVRTQVLPADLMVALCFADYELPAEYEEALKDYNW